MALTRGVEALLIAVGTAVGTALVCAAVAWSWRAGQVRPSRPQRGRAKPLAEGMTWRALGLMMLVALALPWFYGTSDGDELTISGLLTEPGFVGGMLASAVGIACSNRRPWLAASSACAALGLSLWMLPRGERYSGYDVGPGAYLAVAIGTGVLLAALAIQMTMWRR